MKKAISFLLALLLCSSLPLLAAAKSTAVLYADSVSMEQVTTALIPVKLKSNKGIMGFKVTVKYPENLEIQTIARGEITAKGNFYNNLGTKKGEVYIIWNHTMDVKGDGTLFTLAVKAQSPLKKDCKIELSFSQPDTFNEAWEDVVLQCEDIHLRAGAEQTQATTQTVTQATTAPAKEEPTTAMPTEPGTQQAGENVIVASQIVDAVELALEATGAEKLGDVENPEAFVEQVNENLKIITGNQDHFEDFESLEKEFTQSYKSELSKKISDTCSIEELKGIVRESLEKLGAQSVEELNEEQKQQLVESVEKKLQEENPDIPDFSERLDKQQALEVIESLQQEPSNQTAIWWFVAGGCVLLAVAAIIITVRKKSSANSVKKI